MSKIFNSPHRLWWSPGAVLSVSFLAFACLFCSASLFFLTRLRLWLVGAPLSNPQRGIQCMHERNSFNQHNNVQRPGVSHRGAGRKKKHACRLCCLRAIKAVLQEAPLVCASAAHCSTAPFSRPSPSRLSPGCNTVFVPVERIVQCLPSFPLWGIKYAVQVVQMRCNHRKKPGP